MKTLKALLIVTALVASNISMARTGELDENSINYEVSIQEQKSGKVLVGFEKGASEIVKVRIYNAEGSSVYSEKVKEGTLSLKRYDMSHLPAGEYSYEVSFDGYSVEKTITK